MNHTRLIDILSELTHARLTKRQRALVKEMADAIYAMPTGFIVGDHLPTTDNPTQRHVRIAPSKEDTP